MNMIASITVKESTHAKQHLHEVCILLDRVLEHMTHDKLPHEYGAGVGMIQGASKSAMAALNAISGNPYVAPQWDYTSRTIRTKAAD